MYDPNDKFESLTKGMTAQETIEYLIADYEGGTDVATSTVI